MKNIFKKTILCVLSAVMLASSLAGCGTKTGDDSVVEVEFYSTTKEADEASYNIYTKYFTEFEEYYKTAFPDEKPVKVTPNYYGYNPSDYAAMAVGGQLATFYHVPLTEAKGIMEAGYAKDITPWMEKYGYLEGMDEKIRKNIEKDGKIYMLPFNVYSVGIAVNLELFEQAGYIEADGTPHQPATFDELAQMAATIREKTGKAGFATPTINNQGGWRFTPVAWNFGVEFMKQDADGKWQATFNSPEAVNALQWLKDLKWKHNALPENVLLDGGKIDSSFGAGEVAMVYAAPDGIATYISAGMNKDNIGFIQLPAGPERHVTLIGGAYYVFNENATDEQVEAAFRYLDFIGEGRVLNDETKEKMREGLQAKADKGELIGALPASPYTDNDPKRAYEIKLYTEDFLNVDVNHVKLYNDQSNIEWQQEEPVEAQALYAVLDNAVQAVLTDENADCAKLIEEAYLNFQGTLDLANNG
ncbi:MAG: hypothetical protein E7417_01610 [Ruminococcaceae bacterium]|nr:hypothetical protein [Oscillospiraceae bacterium]